MIAPVLRSGAVSASQLVCERRLAVKTLFAAAVAAVVLPVASANALVTPPVTDSPKLLTHTYTLACSLNSFSVEKGKNQILVRNTSPEAIPQGAKIVLTIRTRIHFARIITRTETAYAQVTPGTGTITFNQPVGALSCTAKVTLRIVPKTR